MKQNVLFNASSGKKIVFDGVTFDDNQTTAGPLIEVDNNTFVLKNLTVKNSKSASVNGMISMKKGTLTIDTLNLESCSISNAFIRAAGGTLSVSGGMNLNDSKGNHFRLGNAKLDAATLPAISGAYMVEVEDTAAMIINVSDASMFKLATIGYYLNYDADTKTITFKEESDGQDDEEIVVPEGAVRDDVTPLVDTYIRKGNTGNNGNKQAMEIWTFANDSIDNDFVGLMGFKLPSDLIKEGAELHKAQLRLVSTHTSLLSLPVKGALKT